jgi:hypothetical protein
VCASATPLLHLLSCRDHWPCCAAWQGQRALHLHPDTCTFNHIQGGVIAFFFTKGSFLTHSGVTWNGCPHTTTEEVSDKADK